MKISLLGLITLTLVSMALGADPEPTLYRTSADLTRAKQQVTVFPQMAAARDEILKESAKNVEAWRKNNPAESRPEDKALIEQGRKSGQPPLPDLLTNATAYLFQPTPELGEVIREQILYSVGARQKRGSWRELGIHEGERMMEFLKAYDLVGKTGLLSGEEKQIIDDEIHRAGHFFEVWLLDDSLSSVQRGETYCLNISLYPASVLGAIAMSHPEFPESRDWQQLAEEQLIKYLFTEFALDGGYGEGSEHYYHPTMKALLEFMTASKNLGLHDYAKDEAVAAAIKRALQWRTDLMAPDGHSTAIGDAHREQIGAAEFELAARLFHDPDLAWTGRQMVEQAQQSSGPTDGETFLDPLVTDLALPAKPPARLFSNYPWSGYAFFRSGWNPQANFFVMKYGPTWIGRREAEENAVIPGHSHEDCLEIELHWAGIPMLVDPGVKGAYADYSLYGGYWKATIAHNTVGLGNPYGYDRLDGLYAEHVKQHGEDFRYEREQKMIGRSDYQIKAVGDTGAAALVSVAVHTFENVTQERTAIWLRDNSVTILFDQLTSPSKQPYEWYLHPIGKLLADKNGLTFGDSVAKLKIIPIPLAPVRRTIIQPGDPKAPPYYAALRADYGETDKVEAGARWPFTNLVVESVQAKSAEFFHVLIPYGQEAPYQEEPMGSLGRKLSGKNDTILLAAGGNDDKTIESDGRFGFARLQDNHLTTFALHQGTQLDLNGMPLIKVSLNSPAWAPRYTVSTTALISLKEKRANIGLPPSPLDQILVMANPNTGRDGGVRVVEIKFSFKVNEKPQRMVASSSLTEMPRLEDPDYARKTTGWNPDPVSSRYSRRELAFQYDEAAKMVTVILPPGITQLVWQ